MRLSLGFSGFEPLADTLPLVRAADEWGLDGVWSAEHLGFHDAVVPSAVYTTISDRLEVGLIGQCPISRHPGLLAMELSSLAELAPGRIRVQVGTGAPELVARLGDSTGPKLARVEEFVTALRTLFAGEELTGSYAGHDFAGFAITSVDPPVQIDVMAIRPRMLELAARIGDGVSLSTGASRGYLAGAVAAIESALAESGRDRSEVRIMGGALAAMAPDREQAIDLLIPLLKLFGGGALGVTAPDLFDAEEIAALDGDPEKEAELITPEVAPQLGFVATPDTVAEALVEFKATGIDELNLDFVTPPVESAGLIEALADGWRAMEATAHDAPR